jgi:probable phosphoglycerate mutase
MTTRFVLVRHATCAQTESVLLGRAIDASLDERGERQARSLVERLRKEDPALIETSPRRRARQTAAPSAAALCCEMRMTPDLDELDFGAWSGRSFSDLESDREWRQWNEHRADARTPAGQDIASVQARLASHLRDLADAFAGSTLVLVTHGEVIRSIVLHFRGAPPDDYRHVEISPASLTTLSATSAGMRIDSVNEQVAA